MWKIYFVEYRVAGSTWRFFNRVKCANAANAIKLAAESLKDVPGDLEIRATEEK